MKKENISNLIKYHVKGDEASFKNEAMKIARYFDSIDERQAAEQIIDLIDETDSRSQQNNHFGSDFLEQIETKDLDTLNLPLKIAEDVKGIINAINYNIGINNFLFEGYPGSGKTEVAKYIAKMLERPLFRVNFENLIDSKLGETNKNIIKVFEEINTLPNANKVVILFDEIDVIALDRINPNDIREMGRATSTILREMDRLMACNKDIVVIATTNLYSNFDKALIRRFDAVINFNRYSNKDLIDVGEYYFSSIINNFENASKDTVLFKKILKTAPQLPYPAELKNIIKISLAFSDVNSKYGYLKRLYNSLIGELSKTSVNKLYNKGFNKDEIEKLKNVSKTNMIFKKRTEVDYV